MNVVTITITLSDVPDASEQGQPATVPTHDLEYKGSRVRGSRRVDIIDRFADPLQGRWRANREIRQTHVVIDRSDKPDNAEVTVFGKLVWCDFSLGMERL